MAITSKDNLLLVIQQFIPLSASSKMPGFDLPCWDQKSYDGPLKPCIVIVPAQRKDETCHFVDTFVKEKVGKGGKELICNWESLQNFWERTGFFPSPGKELN